MISFLLQVADDGKVHINKFAESVPVGAGRPMLDPTFAGAVMTTDDRMDMHVKVTEACRRVVVIALYDDAIPQFTSVEEAEEWMATRQSGKYELSHG